MTLPPRPYMPYELSTLHVSRLTPQPRDVRSDRIQRRLPIDALGDGIATVPTQFVQQLAGRADAVILRQKIRPGWRLPTNMGQQTMP